MENCLLNGLITESQRERWGAAVSLRRSVRSFSAAPDVAQNSALNYLLGRISLPGARAELINADPETLCMKLPGVERVNGTDRFAVLLTDADTPRAAEHAGILGEALVLEAVSLGLGACWLGSFKRNGLPVTPQEGEKAVAVIALGVPPESKPPVRKRKTLQKLCGGADPSGWPLWAYNAVECVRNAPSAMNFQPWRFAFAGRTLLLRKTWYATGLDMGIALLHMTLGAGNKPHVLRWGAGRETASLVAEDRL